MDSLQNHSSRAPKITFFLKLIIILLIPIVLIKIFLSLSTNPHVSVTAQPTSEKAKSAPPLTQTTLDDWSKKLASGSEADLRSVVVLPKYQLLPPGALNKLSSLAPFHFKLETFQKNTDNTTGSIKVELGPTNKRKTILVYLQVVNGSWKIVNVEM